VAGKLKEQNIKLFLNEEQELLDEIVLVGVLLKQS